MFDLVVNVYYFTTENGSTSNKQNNPPGNDMSQLDRKMSGDLRTTIYVKVPNRNAFLLILPRPNDLLLIFHSISGIELIFKEKMH